MLNSPCSLARAFTRSRMSRKERLLAPTVAHGDDGPVLLHDKEPLSRYRPASAVR